MKAKTLIDDLKTNGLGPFIQVPCSILGPLITGLEEDPDAEVLSPCNEAVAMGMAAGSYLAGGRIPAVLTQNSGLCNTMNALTSLNQLYRIPVFYVISWRGEPGSADAPEHEIMGRSMVELLSAYDVPFEVLEDGDHAGTVAALVRRAEETRLPVALILRRGVIQDKGWKRVAGADSALMDKATAVRTILEACGEETSIVCTNGFISREAFHAIEGGGLCEGKKVFYMLGSMGHALPIGIGLSHGTGGRGKVLVLDGDGGCLMHMGAMASLEESRHRGLLHVVLDNGVYSSTGGQPTMSSGIDLAGVARSCGYGPVRRAGSESDLRRVLPEVLGDPRPGFLQVMIRPGEVPGRPRVSGKYTCADITDRFMNGQRGGVI